MKNRRNGVAFSALGSTWELLIWGKLPCLLLLCRVRRFAQGSGILDRWRFKGVSVRFAWEPWNNHGALFGTFLKHDRYLDDQGSSSPPYQKDPDERGAADGLETVHQLYVSVSLTAGLFLTTRRRKRAVRDVSLFRSSALWS